MKGKDPSLSNTSDSVTFSLQSGLFIENVTLATNQLNLESLKKSARKFIDEKYPEHGLNQLDERLILFKHDYGTRNMLSPINLASEVTNDCLIEIVVCKKDRADEIVFRPHHLKEKSFKKPTFCDICDKLLYGFVKQGFKCQGCGHTYHKRCSHMIPNDCDHQQSPAHKSVSEAVTTAI